MVGTEEEVWEVVKTGACSNDQGLMFLGDAWYVVFKRKDNGQYLAYEASEKDKHSPSYSIWNYTEAVYA